MHRSFNPVLYAEYSCQADLYVVFRNLWTRRYRDRILQHRRRQSIYFLGADATVIHSWLHINLHTDGVPAEKM